MQVHERSSDEETFKLRLMRIWNRSWNCFSSKRTSEGYSNEMVNVYQPSFCFSWKIRSSVETKSSVTIWQIQRNCTTRAECISEETRSRYFRSARRNEKNGRAELIIITRYPACSSIPRTAIAIGAMLTNLASVTFSTFPRRSFGCGKRARDSGW